MIRLLPQSHSDPAEWAVLQIVESESGERRAAQGSAGEGSSRSEWQAGRSQSQMFSQRKRERQQVGVLEGRAAREPASIVFCFRWVSPHREGTDNAISLAGWGLLWILPWSECSGARTR